MNDGGSAMRGMLLSTKFKDSDGEYPDRGTMRLDRKGSNKIRKTDKVASNDVMSDDLVQSIYKNSLRDQHVVVSASKTDPHSLTVRQRAGSESAKESIVIKPRSKMHVFLFDDDVVDDDPLNKRQKVEEAGEEDGQGQGEPSDEGGCGIVIPEDDDETTPLVEELAKVKMNRDTMAAVRCRQDARDLLASLSTTPSSLVSLEVCEIQVSRDAPKGNICELNLCCMRFS